MPLSRGLYEVLITEAVQQQINGIPASLSPDIERLASADAADRIALHLARVIERALDALPDEDRVAVGAQLAGRLIEQTATQLGGDLGANHLAGDPRLLRAIVGRLPDGRLETLERPMIPLLDTTLLTNAPGEPRVGHQLETEIASADSVDIVMAFIRQTGIRPLRDALRRHIDNGGRVRVLTTTYTGSTEASALELLQQLGADVRVSYDRSTTRLHAKAWLFHRESGFSTAYVGSSNLTQSAQVTGLEWNVRLSEARNRPVIEKVAAVFNSYWEQPDFLPFNPETFREALRIATPDGPAFFLAPIEIRLEPFQERLLEQIELSRLQGHHRNLLVSAPGTGKTVMAAVDYARLATRLPRARLLFVAHREEILQQSRATFAHAMRDASFGELWVGGRRPEDFEQVFASIQSLTAAGLDALDVRHFDIVIVDEFHHATAASYTRLLSHVEPVELLGLTATPERADGVSVLQWFDGRIAAELRLWDAIDQHRLTPFAYYGVADELDLREIPWRRGRGYDVESLNGLLTGNDVWARRVVKEVAKHLGDPGKIRALGFCVSVAHAQFMARVFNEAGIRARAVWSDTPDAERKQALVDLAAGRLNFVFSVDLFNEGVDVPAVDALLMLRPTDSPVLFLQQLGRGLRKSPGKSVCSVLDFVGQHRKEFRYDRRFRALLGGSRSSVIRQIEAGFPFLPAGCHMELDRVAAERVLHSIKRSVPSRWREKATELRRIAAERGGSVSLGDFLEEAGLELEDIYDGNRSWSDLVEEAGVPTAAAGPSEMVLRRACGRLLHVDDTNRLAAWHSWLLADTPVRSADLPVRDRRLLRMLLSQLLDQIASKGMTLDEGINTLWGHPQVRAELLELFEVLGRQIDHLTVPMAAFPEVPILTPARYTRLEILAAFDGDDGVKIRPWREGVYYAKEQSADLMAFTLDKTTGQFSPTTRYRDYAISRELIHWESQSGTSAESPTGRRYQRHASEGGHMVLFARNNTGERAFFCLGTARYESHTGSRPMAVTWRLDRPLPGDLFQAMAAAVA